jgi:hypothetical protein
MIQTASSGPAPAGGLADSPAWFVHALDPVFDQTMVVRHSEEEFRAASFLDDRSLTEATPRQIAPWSSVESAMASAAREDADYIFHIGHVGSTLVSRLLGELPTVFALREPLLLRTFHDLALSAGSPECPWSPERYQAGLAVVRRLLSRTFTPARTAMVKATSFVSEIAPGLVAPGSRALLMYTPAERYLQNILAGEQSRREAHALAGQRLRRMTAWLGELPWRLWELTLPQRAALGWACEMSALERAAAALGEGATRFCDFEAFLARPPEELVRLGAFFGHPIAQGEAERLASGPLMQRYSKGPEHAYSPALREQVLAQSQVENRDSIREGMAWLDQAGGRFPAIAECLKHD